MKPIKVVLVDDHSFIIDSLKQNFSLFPNVEILYTANNGHDLLNKMSKSNTPEIILMDLDMPNMNGIQATIEIRKKFSENIKIILLTVFDDDEKIFDAIKAGVSGYLLKDEKPERIVAAMQEALENGAPMSPGIAFKTLRMLKNSTLDNKTATSSASSISADFNLTVREVEIVKLIADGNTYKQIAERLFISDKTVKKHIENIYKKLHISSKMEVLKILQKYS